jgi:hypothetical protein
MEDYIDNGGAGPPMLQAGNIVFATERLYAAFAAYRSQRPIEACPCCVSLKDQRRLLSKPIPHLSVSDVDHYASNAITTWGTVPDFKQFLPRLLELASIGRTDSYLLDIVSIASKLSYASWSDWPQEERKAISDWFAALWSSLVSIYPSSILASEFLLAADELVLDLQPFIQGLIESGTLPAARHLSQSALSGVWWDSWTRKNIDRPKLYGALITERTLDALETAFFSNLEEKCASELAEGADFVRIELHRS